MALCMGCMSEINDSKICPYCGFDTSSQQKAPYLPYGTLLKNRYTVGDITDSNGESACYVGLDVQTDRVVRIREFLPVGIFERAAGETEVKVSTGNTNMYDGLFNEFAMYYRILAGMKGFSANVDIIEIFSENNTCYVIEEEEELITFSDYVERSGGRLEWDIVRPMLMPVISMLETMHSNGIGHYALSPKNLCVTPDGKIKLLRCSTENVRKEGTALKPSIPAGIAAPEQYIAREIVDEQTDIYCFTALLFYALSGNLPPKAEKREEKLFMNSTVARRLPPHVLSALVNGLQLSREKRIKSFDELRSKLSAESAVEAMREKISKTSTIKSVKHQYEDKPRKSSVPVFLISFVITILVIAIVVAALYSVGFFDNSESTPSTPSVMESTTEEEWTGPVVSNFVGTSYEEALRTLENTGIELVRSNDKVYSDVYEEGVIVFQRPDAGTPIRSADGSAVIYVQVSSGSQLRPLPDIIGYTVDSAATLLGDSGFIVSEISEYSDSVPLNCVIGYDGYQPGDRLDAGSSVILRVSKGPAPTNDTETNFNGQI